MRTLRGGSHFQNQNAGFHFAGFDGSAGGSGNFVTGGDFDFELSGFSLHHGNVGERGDSNFSFADGDECFHVGQKADFFRHDGSGGFPSCPPDICLHAGNERRFDGGLAVRGRPRGDEARADANISVIARNNEGEAHASCRRRRKAERGTTRFDIQRETCVETHGKF